MSFILDALKKSEAERRQGAGPDLGALHTAPAERSGRRLWPLLLTVALLLNALLLLCWLRPWASSDDIASPTLTVPVAATTAAPAPVPTPTPALIPAPRAAPPPSPPQAPAGWNELPAAPAPASAPEGRKRKAERTEIPWLHDLTAEIRRQVPELAITLHYYTSDPATRLARVNGVILREGEKVNGNLVLERITASTLIFRLGEIRFRTGEF